MTEKTLCDNYHESLEIEWKMILPLQSEDELMMTSRREDSISISPVIFNQLELFNYQ